MNTLQKSLLTALGVGVAICAVPILGAVVGASLAANGFIGGLIGLAVGAAVAPLPVAIAATRKPEGNKSRVRRIGEFMAGMYGAVGLALNGLLGSPFRGFKKHQAPVAPVPPTTKVPPVDDKTPIRVPDTVSPAFDAKAQKPEAGSAPAAPQPAPEAPKPPTP